MIKQTLQEWMNEGQTKFGKDLKDWKFKCPACGHISTIKDFIDAGAKANYAYQMCIGRVNGKGINGMQGADEGFGCNWAAYGLFGNLGKGRVILDKDKEIQIFDFAE